MKKPNSVFVTGAEGFIGSHLVESLIRQGFNVKALVQYNSFNNVGWLSDLPNSLMQDLEIVLGDVRDVNFMRKEIKGMDYVVHLAALIAIPFSYASPKSYVDTNISGTLNVLEACRDYNVSLIHTSTSEVYGSASYVPIDEAHPLQGQSPYSASKIAADQLAYSYFSSFDVSVKIVRPFNTYGPRQSLRAVIPTIISQIANGAENIELGSTYPTRDFTFVDDTVSGFMSAMTSSRGFGEVVNLGSNFEISIGDTVNIIAKLMGVEVKIITSHLRERPRKSEVNRLFASNIKAKQLYNWQPKYSGLEGFEAGLAKAISWFSREENLKRYNSDEYVI